MNTSYALASLSRPAIAFTPTARFSSAPVACEARQERRSRAWPCPKAPVDPSWLPASHVEDVARREIEWFLTTEATDEASELARARIQAWALALDPDDQETLTLRYDPMPPCPRSLEEHWSDGGFALAIRLLYTQTWRPNGRPRNSTEREVSDQLEASVERNGSRVLEHVKSRADVMFSSALAAYIRVRGCAPCVIPGVS